MSVFLDALDTVKVRRCDVPEYLRAGEFFASLGDEDDSDSPLDIPSQVIKLDNIVENVESLRCLLLSLRFWLVRTFPVSAIAYIYNNWSECGQVRAEFEPDFPILKSIVAIAHLASSKQMSAAVKSGHMELAKWLVAQGMPVVVKHTLEAAQSGNVEMLKYTYSITNKLFLGTAHAAAASGSLACLQFALEHGCRADPHLIATAAAYDHLHIVRYLVLELHCPLNAHIFSRAAQTKRVEILQFLHEQGCPWAADTIMSAAERVSIECLLYVVQHGAPFSEGAVTHIINTGRADMLALLLRERPAEWTDNLLRYAAHLSAEKGQLACLTLVHEAGALLNIHDACVAAQNGQLDCLQYLIEHGVELKPYISNAAARKGQLHCLRYLHHVGCPIETCSVRAACCEGQLQCLAFLHSCGVPWDESCCAVAAQYGQLDCLRYLHEQGCPWNGRTLVQARLNKRTDCLEYAEQHGCPKTK